MTAREIALKALYDIEVNDAYLNAALKTALKNDGLNSSDRGLVTELIYGVVTNKSALDFIISRYSKIKLKKMTPWVLSILRMGVFQIYFMDKIPPSAACNEGVKLAKKYSHKAGAGFVNGVLRSFAREWESFEFPECESAEETLSLRYSYPLWITKKLVEEYGRERCEELFEENRRAHGTFLRVNSLKTTSEELVEILEKEGVFARTTETENCLQVDGKINIEGSLAYKEGLFSLQNLSSQKTVLCLDPRPRDIVIDMCAAPGGKSCAAAERMKNQGKVFSFDVFEHKIKLISDAAKRLGITIVEPRVQDGRETVDELIESADCVLADVPCSGLGVLHKKPDVKWKRTPEDVTALCLMQKEILETAAKYVKKGGTLVYSTCTILPEENRLRKDAFLEEHKEFKLVFEEQIMTSRQGESGFYICKMLKG